MLKMAATETIPSAYLNCYNDRVPEFAIAATDTRVHVLINVATD